MPTTGEVYTSYVASTAFASGELGTPNQITWELHIKRNDDAAIIADREWSAIIAEGGHVPDINSFYPFPSPIPSGARWEQYARCRSANYRSGPRGILIVSVVWSTLYMYNPDDAAHLALPSSIEYSSRTRSATLYRTAWTVDPPTGSANESAEINGTAITGAFVGKAEQVNQVAIKVRITYDASVTTMDQMYTSNFPIVGKRNSAAFAGFPAYSLVCNGMTLAKQGSGFEFYEGTFDITWDQWYHFDQVATLAEGGLPRQNSTYGPDEVKWKRIDRAALDFNQMFPNGAGGVDADWQALTIRGWWP